jgi:hypothetical protein
MAKRSFFTEFIIKKTYERLIILKLNPVREMNVDVYFEIVMELAKIVAVGGNKLIQHLMRCKNLGLIATIQFYVINLF